MTTPTSPSPCLAHRRPAGDTVSVCLACRAVCYGARAEDERCCDWYTCSCPRAMDNEGLDGDDICSASECIACALNHAPCHDPLHYHHDGCPVPGCDENGLGFPVAKELHLEIEAQGFACEAEPPALKVPGKMFSTRVFLESAYRGTGALADALIADVAVQRRCFNLETPPLRIWLDAHRVAPFAYEGLYEEDWAVCIVFVY